MLTIRTTGDDAYDTDALLIAALEGYEANVNGESMVILGIDGADGSMMASPLDGSTVRAIPIEGTEIEVF